MNKNELISEYLILTYTTMMLTFTEFASDPFAKYDAGWAQVIIASILIVFNMVVVFIKNYKGARRYPVKYYRIIHHYLEKKNIIRIRP